MNITSKNGHLDNFLINRVNHFSTDYDEFAIMLKNANLEQQLMERGKFKGSVKMVVTSNVIVGHFNLNRKMLQVGTSVPGYITFVIWEPKVFVSWRKHEMTHGMIGVLWKNEHESITNAGLNGLPVSIKEKKFANYCELKGYPELVNKLKNCDVLKVSETGLGQIRQIVKAVTHFGNLDSKVVNEFLETKLIDLLVNCLIEAYPKQPEEDLPRLKFVNLVEYIHEKLTEIESVKQICEDTKVPERTLRRLFHKKYNLAPKTYLNILRLNAVRKKLKSNFGISNITQISNEYNFWHMGQFASDYRKLFGELPSETVSAIKYY